MLTKYTLLWYNIGMNVKNKIRNELHKRTVAMSRGAIVLDENLWGELEFEIASRHIKVFKPYAGQSDESMAAILYNKILVTDNSKDFIENITSWEFGIIATENIKFKDSKKLANLISKAIIKHSLWSKRSGFIVTLYNTKDSTIKYIKD